MLQIELLRELFKGLKASPLPAICTVLVASTVYLFFSLIEAKGELRTEEKKYNAQTAALIKQHSETIAIIKDGERVRTDSVLRAELVKTQRQNHELEGLIKDLRKIKIR